MQGIIKKSLSLFLALALVATAFGLTAQTVSAVTAPTSLTLKVESGNTTSGVVDYGGKVKVYLYSTYPSYAAKSVTWSVYSGSSYGKIVSSTSTYCYVQGIKYGTITIKAKSKYYPYVTKYIKVYARQLYPTGLTLNKTSIGLWNGTSDTITATVVKKPWVYSNPVTWSTSNSKAATVSGGKVTAVTNGAATITAKYIEGTKTFFTKTCPVSVYKATQASKRVALDKGSTIDNPYPVTVYGPTGTVAPTSITYASDNAAVAVNASTGALTGAADGSANVSATVSLSAITVATKTTKLASYPVNVRSEIGVVQDESYDFPAASAKLEIVDAGHGFTGVNSMLLNKTMLDDFFGYGSMGIDLFNPMDVCLNFMDKTILWNAGGFVFDKAGDSVEVSAMKDGLPWYAPYYLYNVGTADDSLVLSEDAEGLCNGYDLRFYHEAANAAAGYVTLSLADNVLTVPFAGESLALKRLASNKVQVLADADAGGVLDDVVLTIVRTADGHKVIVNDAAYMTDKGIRFYTYKTYL